MPRLINVKDAHCPGIAARPLGLPPNSAGRSVAYPSGEEQAASRHERHRATTVCSCDNPCCRARVASPTHWESASCSTGTSFSARSGGRGSGGPSEGSNPSPGGSILPSHRAKEDRRRSGSDEGGTNSKRSRGGDSGYPPSSGSSESGSISDKGRATDNPSGAKSMGKKPHHRDDRHRGGARRKRFKPNAKSARIVVHIDQLKPTQFTVGLDDVRQQMDKIEKAGRGGGKKGIKRMVAERTVPVVLGPRGDVFLVDRHHFCRALWESNVPARYKYLRCKAIADLSG